MTDANVPPDLEENKSDDDFLENEKINDPNRSPSSSSKRIEPHLNEADELKSSKLDQNGSHSFDDDKENTNHELSSGSITYNYESDDKENTHFPKEESSSTFQEDELRLSRQDMKETDQISREDSSKTMNDKSYISPDMDPISRAETSKKNDKSAISPEIGTSSSIEDMELNEYENVRAKLSRLNLLSRGSVYFQEDYVDKKLAIVTPKLDKTLWRLFSGKDTRNFLRKSSDVEFYLDYSQADLINLDPVIWALKPIDPVHKETLEVETPFLEEKLGRIKEIMHTLYERKIFTHLDYSQMCRTEGQGKKATIRLLVKTLQRRGEKAYPAFLQVLTDIGLTQVHERLSATEKAIEQGIAIDKEHFNQRHNLTQPTTSRTYNLDIPSYTRITSTPDTTYSVSTTPLKQSYSADDSKQEEEIPRSEMVSAKSLTDHIQSLSQEIKMLHDDVTALKTSRSKQGSRTSQFVDEKTPTVTMSQTDAEKQIDSNVRKDKPKVDTKPQKTSSCSVL